MILVLPRPHLSSVNMHLPGHSHSELSTENLLCLLEFLTWLFLNLNLNFFRRESVFFWLAAWPFVYPVLDFDKRLGRNLPVCQAQFSAHHSAASWPILYVQPPKIIINYCIFCLAAVAICPSKVHVLRFISCTQIWQFPREKCSYRNSAQYFQFSPP